MIALRYDAERVMAASRAALHAFPWDPKPVRRMVVPQPWDALGVEEGAFRGWLRDGRFPRPVGRPGYLTREILVYLRLLATATGEQPFDKWGDHQCLTNLLSQARTNLLNLNGTRPRWELVTAPSRGSPLAG